jgi:hypothetical protein
LTLFHAGDIADRRLRLQPINQPMLGGALAIVMMIITKIFDTRENFQKINLS